MGALIRSWRSRLPRLRWAALGLFLLALGALWIPVGSSLWRQGLNLSSAIEFAEFGATQATPTPTGSATATPTPTGSATATPTPTGSATATPTPISTASGTPLPTATVHQTATPTPSASAPSPTPPPATPTAEA